MPAPAAQGVSDVNGVKLYWASFGDSQSPTVILLHGGAGNSDHWANQVPALAAKFRVIVVDSRGHGRSTRDEKPMSYALMAEDLVGLMDALGVQRAALVGWSDGGAVALEVALRFPSRLTHLVAYGTNFNLGGLKKGGSSSTFTTYFARCAADAAKRSTPEAHRALLEALRPMWRTQPAHTPEELTHIHIPTLVLDGAHDEIIRREHSLEFARSVPSAKVVFIPDASHFALFQQPAAFNAALLEFLER
jgi:pimeloyl-ACP methyl ester carboxylesterase